MTTVVGRGLVGLNKHNYIRREMYVRWANDVGRGWIVFETFVGLWGLLVEAG